MGFFQLTKKWTVIVVFILLLSSCQSEMNKGSVSFHSEKPLINHHEKKKLTEEPFIPLHVNEQTFRFIIGWISNEEILVNEDIDGESIISTYNIKTGKKINKIRSEHVIHEASISPSKKYLFIHSSSSSNEANISVYRLDNYENVYDTSIESSDITYEWNSNDEEKILLIGFYEDWTFDSFIINIDEHTKKKISLSQPFAFWLDQSSFILLDWNNDEPSTTAPLVIDRNGKKERVFSNDTFYYLYGWKDLFLSIKVSDEDENKAEMELFNRNLQTVYSFQIPHLVGYSEWQIPYFELIPNSDEMYIIEPVESGEADIYMGGYQFVKRNFSTDDVEVILQSTEHAPLSCSPNGNYCLSGYQFENIILINEKKQESFLKIDGNSPHS